MTLLLEFNFHRTNVPQNMVYSDRHYDVSMSISICFTLNCKTLCFVVSSSHCNFLCSLWSENGCARWHSSLAYAICEMGIYQSKANPDHCIKEFIGLTTNIFLSKLVPNCTLKIINNNFCSLTI
jgi:hypothetical protein